DQAEHAYRQSLALEVQQKNHTGEALTLNELGNLYDDRRRLEEACAFYRQAADIYTTQDNLIGEGLARHNLGSALLQLKQYDEARRELQRVVECNKPSGHAAEPWKTWAILYDLEQATGNPQAAAAARQQAVQYYLAYRRDGGESQQPSASLCAFIANA